MAQIEIKEIKSIESNNNVIIVNGKTVYDSSQNITLQVIVHGDVGSVDAHNVEVHGSVIGDVKSHNLTCEVVGGNVIKAHNVHVDTIVGDIKKAHNVSK
jgi:hypothetical protein